MLKTNSFCVALVAAVAIQTLTAQPQTLQIGEHTLTKASQATRSRLFGSVNIYRVSLYVDQTHATLDALRALRSPIARRVDILYEGSLPDEIPSDWKRELMPALGPGQQKSLVQAYARLSPRDSIEIRFAPGEGTTVSVSGRRILTDDGFELIAAFLDIWMGQTPVSDDIKDQLIAGLRQR